MVHPVVTGIDGFTDIIVINIIRGLRYSLARACCCERLRFVPKVEIIADDPLAEDLVTLTRGKMGRVPA
ncbi:MAG: hypothetical protein R3F19_09185 [Verrucomicrobiales bacterium]